MRETELPRTRRKRGSLSPDEIVAASLALLDREGESALTFARLGTELKASPTAVYRHFASRAELVRAIADELDGISLSGYAPSDDWRADLAELGWRAWRTALAHPAAASISMDLITNGPHELRAVDAVLRALHMAGLRGREAVVQYQLYANLVLGAAQAQARRIAAAEDILPAGAWHVYALPDPVNYPYADGVALELRHVDYEEVFAKLLEMYVSALSLIVPDAS